MVEIEKPASVKSVASGETVDKNMGGVPVPARNIAKKPKRKMSWRVILFIFAGGFVLFALILVNVAKPKSPGTTTTKPGGGGTSQTTVPTPTVIPLPTLPEFQPGDPTVYNTDPQIIQLEGLMKNFDRSLDNLDYREQDLDPPSLLMKVSFGK